MRAIEKLWSVVYNINEVSKITPSNEPCAISPSVFEHIAKGDVDKIFRKLSKDNKVINLINVPETENIVHADDDVRDYDYIVGVLPAFEAFFEDTYRLYHQGIHKLGAKNFLAIHELVLDIEQEIEMSDSDTVTVELLNHTMRFSGLLFPQDTPHFRDAYCELRMKSASYLKRHGAIKSYNLIGEGSGSSAKIEIKFDAYAFDGFADKTKFRYKEEFHNRAGMLAKDFRKKGVFINKESKPQVEHPDDTASEPYEEPAEEPAEPKHDQTPDEKVRFDAKASRLTFNGKTCGIPDETLEYYICKLVFKNRKAAAKEDDILEYTTKSQDSQRAVYDAMLRVNKKANQQLGLGKLLSYKAAKVRITAKYQ